jgi:mRNA interferase RelE/StbE
VNYRIETVSSRIKRELFRIPPLDRQRIAEAVHTLADNPRPPGVKQLELNVYRLRVGDYRVIYKVFDAANWGVFVSATELTLAVEPAILQGERRSP